MKIKNAIRIINSTKFTDLRGNDNTGKVMKAIKKLVKVVCTDQRMK